MPEVIWLGADAMRKHHPNADHHATHTLDCKWALGVEEREGSGGRHPWLGASPWPRVPASSVPSDAPRCSHCGGGR